MQSTNRLLSLFCILLLAGCAGTEQAVHEAPAPTPAPAVADESLAQRASSRPIRLPPQMAQAIERGTRTATGLPGPNYWQQEVDYELTATLLPDAKRLEGTAEVRYTNNAPNALPVLVMELVQNVHAEGAMRNEVMEVTGGVELRSVRVNGQVLEEVPTSALQAVSAGYSVESTALILKPAQALAPGAEAEIEVAWAFTIPQAGASGRMGYSGSDLFFIAYWYPQMAVYDDVEGWNTEPFLGRSEFYADHGDYEVTIDVPEGWLVMATGELENADEVLAPDVAERMRQAYASDTPVQVVGPEGFGEATAPSEDGRLRYRFTAERVRDVAFTAGRAFLWEAARTPVGDRDGDGEVEYSHINTFYRTSAPLWSEVTRYQQHAITFLSEFTGFPYPYPHMTAVEGSGIIGGGMEFPMMTLMGDYNARGDSALYSVTAHELAHMWIPMIVSVNERRYSWIDEGSTTFAENQARKDFYPGPKHDLPDQQSYLQVAQMGLEGEMMRLSNYHDSDVAFGIASYSKPASVLVALRAVLGEETFREAYRAFISTWAYKHPYPFDFFNTFERASGRDLDWFWRGWYYGTGTLDQAITSVEVGENEVEVTVENQGEVPMPVLLRVTYEDGTTAEEEIPVDVWLSGREEAVAAFEGGEVARVEIDPEAHFPDVDRADNAWTR